MVSRDLATLLDGVRDRDPAAVADLVARFRDSAQRLAESFTGDRHLAEEAVQEALVAALGGLNQLRSPEAFPGWFRQLVRTHACRIRRRQHCALELEEASGREPAPLENAELCELRNRVRAALANLPPASQRSAELFYMQERSVAEIAAILEVPSGTVKRRLHDARKLLREMLADCSDVIDRRPCRPD